MYPSIVRSVVPFVVAIVLGQAARVGLDLDPGAVTAIVTAVIGAAYVAVSRFIESEWPAAGRALMSLGLTRGTNPSYERTAKGAVKLPRA